MSQQRGAARMWWTYDRNETVLALQELEAIGERLGGGFVVTPVRNRVIGPGCPECGQPAQSEDWMCPVHGLGPAADIALNDPSGKPLYQTVCWCFKHESFMPAVDPSRAPPPPPPAMEPDADLTEEEMELHFPESAVDPVLAAEETGQVIQAELDQRDEPVYGDPTEGLTPQEIEAQRAARAAGTDPEAADAIVAAGDGGTQS